MARSRLSFSKMLPPPLQAKIHTAVPFFSRLRIRYSILLASLLVLCMTVSTSLQVRETLQEVQREAVNRSLHMTADLAPAIFSLHQHDSPEALKHFLTHVAAAGDIDYVQIVEPDGRVRATTEPEEGGRVPTHLRESWLQETLRDDHLLDSLPSQQSEDLPLDRQATYSPWTPEGSGVDIFVMLQNSAEITAEKPAEAVPYLRIGLNFNSAFNGDLSRVRWRIVFISAVLLIVLLAIFFLLLHYILRPLQELHSGLRALASGNLEHQIPVHNRDEMGQLAQAFNATTVRLKEAFEQVESLATHDALTNLPNRRVFEERLAEEAARSRRYGHPFGLIMLDLDHFKSINDQYGHPAGDEVLRFVARMIEAHVRETDLPARVGGEEFAIILPVTTYFEVAAVAEKLCTAVRGISPPAKNGLPEGICITLSAGAVCSAGHLVTPEGMLAAADAALYQSKGGGRNRITMAPMLTGKTCFLPSIRGPEDPDSQFPFNSPGSSIQFPQKER